MRFPRHPHSNSARLAARPSVLECACLSVLGALPLQAAASPGDVEFNTAMFTSGDGRSSRSAVDVQRYSRADALIAGAVERDVMLNGEWKGRLNVTVREAPGGGSILCVDDALLVRLGVDMAKIEQDTQAAMSSAADASCHPLSDRLPGAEFTASNSGLDLDLRIPAIYLARQDRDHAPPALWDAGVTAAMLRYHVDYVGGRGQGQANDTVYAGLEAGVNVGMWRVRSHGSLRADREQGMAYRATQTYAQRDVTRLRSTLTVGDTYSRGEAFDSLAIRGLTLETEERMLPYSALAHAPVIRGVAQSNAQVTIRQGERVLLETSVPAGAFEIDDLVPPAGSGDITVTVRESDGQEHTFVVPYIATPLLLRRGQTLYALAAGAIRDGSADGVGMAEITARHGLTANATVYGGAIVLPDYRAHQMGTAFTTPLGAFSFDLTRSRAQAIGPRTRHGESFQFRYNRDLWGTGTLLSLGAYRYSTSGYLSVTDALALQDRWSNVRDSTASVRPRSRFDVSLQHALPAGLGHAYLSSSTTSFWDQRTRVRTYSARYQKRWRRATVDVVAQRVLMPAAVGGRNTDDMFGISVSVPLGSDAYAPRTSVGVRERNGDTTVNLALDGIHGDARRLSYAVRADTAEGHLRQVSVGAGYSAGAADLYANVAHADGQTSFLGQARGTVLAHAGGITFGKGGPGIDTLALVHAPDASGATLGSGAKVDRRGYAIETSVTPYRLNNLQLDPAGTRFGLEMASSNEYVVPRQGAVAAVSFATRYTPTHVIAVATDAGASLPFGADVLDEHGHSVGVVGQGGTLIVRRPDRAGRYSVASGDAAQTCTIDVPADMSARAALRCERRAGDSD